MWKGHSCVGGGYSHVGVSHVWRGHSLWELINVQGLNTYGGHTYNCHTQ